MTDDELSFSVWRSNSSVWNGSVTNNIAPNNWNSRNYDAPSDENSVMIPSNSNTDPICAFMPENQSAIPQWNVNMGNSIWASDNLPAENEFNTYWSAGGSDHIAPNEVGLSIITYFQSWVSPEDSSPGIALTNSAVDPSSDAAVSVSNLSVDSNRDGIAVDESLRQIVSSNDGWGKRSIDQTRPWDMSDLEARMMERRERNEQPTPTPSVAAAAVAANQNVHGFPILVNQDLPPPPPPIEPALWTQCPPTGTRVWELHYENMGIRPPFRPSDSINPPRLNTGIQPPGVINPIENDYDYPLVNWNGVDGGMWRGENGPSGDSGARPLLGGRGLTQSDVSWGGGGSNFDVTLDPRNARPWNDPSGSHGIRSLTSPHLLSGNSLQRNVPMNSGFGTQMMNHPSFNNQKPIGQRMLKSGNDSMGMTGPMFDSIPDAGDSQSRNRFHAGMSSFNQSMSAGMNNGPMTGLMDNQPGPFLNSHNNMPPPLSQQPPPSLGSQARMKQQHFNYPSSSSSFGGNAAVSPSPQSGHIRQQLSSQQQPRSSFFPSQSNNPMMGGGSSLNSGGGVPGNTAAPGGSIIGGSLLGQPPPPSLNNNSGGGGFNAATNSSNQLPPIGGQLPPPLSGNRSLATGPPSSVGAGRRTARQHALITSINELQHKRQSIQQQFLLYKNNPNMYSQPQYNDVCNELQGQMQHIGSQLQAKQNQLQCTFVGNSQDGSSSSSSGNINPSLSNGPPPYNQSQIPSNAHNFNSSGGNGPMMPPSIDNQELLSQQFTQMRLRSQQQQSGPDDNSDFLRIGTWVPRSSRPEMVGMLGGGGSINRGLNSSHNRMPLVSGGGGDHFRGSDASGTAIWLLELSEINPRLATALDPQFPGQWLLIRTGNGTTNTSSNGPGAGQSEGISIDQLHQILSALFRIAYFHVINSEQGSALVCFQSVEDALRVKKGVLGDKISFVQTVATADARMYMDRIRTNSLDAFSLSFGDQLGAGQSSNSMMTWNGGAGSSNSFAVNNLNPIVGGGNRKPPGGGQSLQGPSRQRGGLLSGIMH